MTPDLPAREELRVLVLAPIGRDAEVTCELLRGEQIECLPCRDLHEVARELRVGAGALIVTTEVLEAWGIQALRDLLASQEPWSDVPLVVATAQGESRQGQAILTQLERAGAITVLERPIRLLTLRTVVQSALRTRQRQYEMRDLIEQLRVTVQRLDAARLVRDRFVSLLAHDLRGPLTTAMMSARTLLARPQDLDSRRELALRIERSMLRIDSMIRDLLDANRLRAGHKLPLDPQPCDLAEILHDLAAEVDERDRPRLQVETPERLEGVWGPAELRRAIWNLLTNAFKYGAPEGRVEVRAGELRDQVVVSVRNEGPPIPAEERSRIFEPFGRATENEARIRGWGLGLTLVRGCAEAHGGTLELSSTTEEGTIFTMRLPRDARPFTEATTRAR